MVVLVPKFRVEVAIPAPDPSVTLKPAAKAAVNCALPEKMIDVPPAKSSVIDVDPKIAVARLVGSDRLKRLEMPVAEKALV